MGPMRPRQRNVSQQIELDEAVRQKPDRDGWLWSLIVAMVAGLGAVVLVFVGQ